MIGLGLIGDVGVWDVYICGSCLGPFIPPLFDLGYFGLGFDFA